MTSQDRRPSHTITRTELQARHPQACVVHGWRLSGVGPARFGWWAEYPTGACTFLGRTLAECGETLSTNAA